MKYVHTIAGAFGGALAFGVGHMDQVRGLQAWRWLFIIEGIPSCICSVICFFFFPDFPETSRWLSVEEKNMAIERLQGIASLGHAKITWYDAKTTLLDWRLYLHYATCVAFSCAFSGVSLFVPTIVSGLGYQGLAAQLFTVPPYAIAFVVTVFVAWQADKHGMRSWGAFICFMVSGISFVVQGTKLLILRCLTFDAVFRCIAVSRIYSSIRTSLHCSVIHIRYKPSIAKLAYGERGKHRRNDIGCPLESICRSNWTANR